MYLRGKEEFEEGKARGYIQLILEVLTDFYPEEHTMLSCLAMEDLEFFNNLASDSPEYITHLVGYGIISKNYDKNGYDFKIDAVKKYLQDGSRFVSLNLTVEEMRQEISQRRIDLELKLRDIIRMRMLGRYKVEEASEKVWETLKSDNRKKKLISFNYRELFDPTKLSIYFDALRKLVENNWELFEEIFENREEFGQVMQSLNKYRRVDAHSTKVTKTQLTDFRVNMEWMDLKLATWKQKTG